MAERKQLAARQALESGEYAYQLGLLKERALHQWRDQERQARSEVAAIYDTEGILHSLWRHVAGNTRKSLATPQAAETVLGAWRAPPTSPGDSKRGTTGAPIDDPTARTLERVVRDAPARWADYQ
jgi:hypothetical protein